MEKRRVEDGESFEEIERFKESSRSGVLKKYCLRCWKGVVLYRSWGESFRGRKDLNMRVIKCLRGKMEVISDLVRVILVVWWGIGIRLYKLGR